MMKWESRQAEPDSLKDTTRVTSSKPSTRTPPILSHTLPKATTISDNPFASPSSVKNDALSSLAKPIISADKLEKFGRSKISLTLMAKIFASKILSTFIPTTFALGTYILTKDSNADISSRICHTALDLLDFGLTLSLNTAALSVGSLFASTVLSALAFPSTLDSFKNKENKNKFYKFSRNTMCLAGGSAFSIYSMYLVGNYILTPKPTSIIVYESFLPNITSYLLPLCLLGFSANFFSKFLSQKKLDKVVDTPT